MKEFVMRKYKRLLAFMLAFVMVISGMNLSVFEVKADTGSNKVEGTFTDGSTWYIDLSGNLSFRGWGTSEAYSSPLAVPWSSYSSSILHATVPDGFDIRGMNYWFYDCSSLRSVSNYGLENVESMVGTFYGCNGLTTAPDIPIYVGDLTDTFKNCSNLQGEINIYATPYAYDGFFEGAATSGKQLIVNYTNDNAHVIDDIIATKSVNSNIVKGRNLDAAAYGTFGHDNASTWAVDNSGTLTIECNGDPGVRFSDSSDVPWKDYRTEITDVVLQGSSEPKNVDYWFYGCSNLVNVPYFMKPTSFDHTFYGCSSLESVDIHFINETVTNMTSTFEGCKSLSYVDMPSSAINMTSTFKGCKSLSYLSYIPNDVTNMTSTFEGCTALTDAPTIPSSVTNMDSTFKGCTSLTGAPIIPSSVTNMTSTFEGCTSLTGAPVIPNSVTNMASTFEGCTSLTHSPVIPNSVTNMHSTFKGCTAMYYVDGIGIPSSVTNMTSTFEGCSNLTGMFLIESTPSQYSNCFSGAAINDGCYLDIDYLVENEDIIDSIIETKSDNSNIFKHFNMSPVSNLDLSETTKVLTYPTSGTFTVTRNSSGGVLSVMSSNPSVATASISGNTVTVTPGTTSGTATITVVSAKIGSYQEGRTTCKVTVNNGTLSVNASGYSGEYDGVAHGISVIAPSDSTIKYGTTSGTYDLTSNPTYTNAGTYTVYYQVTKPGYTTVTGSETVTISKLNNTLALSATSGNVTYPATTTFTIETNTSDGALSVESSNTEIATASISGNIVTITSGATAGMATITVTSDATSNYNAATATYDVTVEGGALTPTVKNTTHTYDGQPHTLSVECAGAVITYSNAQDGTYVANAPTFTNAGTHTVWYKVVKSGYETINTSAVLTINKASASLTLPESVSKVYGDGEFKLSVSKVGESTPTFVSDNTEVVTVDNDGNVSIHGAGTAVITVSLDATDNYEATETTVAVSVAKKDATLVLAKEVLTMYCGDELNLELTYEGEAALRYSTSDEDIAVVNEDGVVEALAYGTATITVKADESANYNAVEKQVNVTVLNVAPTITEQPVTVKTTLGNDVVFRVEADGSANKYQWYSSTTGLKDGAAIAGATQSTYTIPKEMLTHSLNNRYFYCEVRNVGNEPVMSNVAQLQIIAKPTQPKFQLNLQTDTWVTGEFRIELAGSTINGATDEMAYKYSINSGATWEDYDNVIIWTTDTNAGSIIAKAYNTKYPEIESETNILLFKYDATPPVINEVSVDGNNIIVDAMDAMSGISGYSIRKEVRTFAMRSPVVGDTWETTPEFTINDGGSYYVCVKDKAGNIAYSEPFTVKQNQETCEHDYVLTKDVNATCTEDGYTGDNVCTICEHTIEGFVIDATGHDTEIVDKVDVTCTEDGHTGNEVCKVCKITVTVGTVIKATGHKTGTTDAKEPTCTEDGYTGAGLCTECGEELAEGEVIPATGHTFSEWETTTDATCTEDGAKERTCTVCDVVENDVIAATGHDYKDVVTEPTCTEKGYTTYTCANCDDSYVDDEVDAIGHTWDDGVVTKEPTTEDTGIKTYSCTVCDATKEEILAKVEIATPGDGTAPEDKPSDDDVTVESVKDALNEVITDVSDEKADEYTAESWAEFQRVLEEVLKLMQSKDATKEELEAAKIALDGVIKALQPVTPEDKPGNGDVATPGDGTAPEDKPSDDDVTVESAKEALNEVITNVSDEKADEYTAESWAEFQKALEEAMLLMQSPDATKEELDAAKIALNIAIEALQPVTPESIVESAREALNEVITNVFDKNSGQYTPESWAEFQRVLEEAQMLIRSETATKEELDIVKAMLEAALAALKPVDSTTPDEDDGIEIRPGEKLEDDTTSDGGKKPEANGFDDKKPSTPNVTLQYDLTFVGNKGKIDKKLNQKTLTITSGKKIDKLPKVTRKGYVLKGWYTAKKGGKKITKNTVVTKGMTLYARWTKVKVAKAKIKSASVKNKKLVASLKKVKGVKGYEISYANNKKFKKATVKNLKAKNVKFVSSKLKAGKTYFVRLRVFKKDSTGKKVFGKWSTIKKVTVK